MIIQTENLHKRFGRHGALNGLNLSVPEGSAYALIGANGAGKTTTIRLLMNIIAPSQGHATVLGTDSRALSPAQFRQIGYVSENQEIPGAMTVAQYIAYLRPFYPAWDMALEARILGQLCLPPERKVGQLSHGMRMKLALACALPFRPRLLVLDEPFSGLDPLMRDELVESVLAQAGEMTILISSQELPEIESFTTDIGFLQDGNLLFQEPIESLQARLKAVRLVLDHAAVLPAQIPPSWLDVRAEGNVLSFVDTAYAEQDFAAHIAALVGEVARVSLEPIPLRSFFTTMARAARNGGQA